MYLLGLDIGSSSVKASVLNANTGKCLASDYFPKTEMPIIAHQTGWAEQDPKMWWENAQLAIQSVLSVAKIDRKQVKAIGISYQMHGLVCIDKNLRPVRPATPKAARCCGCLNSRFVILPTVDAKNFKPPCWRISADRPPISKLNKKISCMLAKPL